MQQTAQGGRDALDVLARRHAGPLLTFLTRMTGDRHRSEELFQEVFLTVWTKRRQFKAKYRFKPWLYRIAINKCRAAFRRRTIAERPLQIDEDLAVAAVSGCGGSDPLVAAERTTLVQAALATLSAKQRIVLTLRVWSEMSYGEIAAIVGRSEATVRSHMHHALAAIRGHLRTREEP